MTTTLHTNDDNPATEQGLERRLVASEIRRQSAERLHDVDQARQYIFAQATEIPTATVLATDQAPSIEPNPAVASHIVSAAATVETSALQSGTSEASVNPIDPTNVDAIRANVAALANQSPSAQSARDEYGIFS